MIPSYHQNVRVQVEDSRYLRVEFLKALHFQIKISVFSRSVCRFVMKKEIVVVCVVVLECLQFGVEVKIGRASCRERV